MEERARRDEQWRSIMKVDEDYLKRIIIEYSINDYLASCLHTEFGRGS
jgi:hypothetical protein